MALPRPGSFAGSQAQPGSQYSDGSTPGPSRNGGDNQRGFGVGGAAHGGGVGGYGSGVAGQQAGFGAPSPYKASPSPYAGAPSPYGGPAIGTGFSRPVQPLQQPQGGFGGSMNFGTSGSLGGTGTGRPPNMAQDFNWNQWAPDGMNAQMLNMGQNVAKSFISSNMARYQPGMFSFWFTLKYYFAVNNSYVLKKLKVLLCPVLKRNWTRIHAQELAGGDEEKLKYARPWADDNAPDLYIPLMAFITFVLVTGFIKGMANTFTPEVLTEVTMSCVVTSILEVGLIRLGLYLMGAPAVTVDLFAWTGYKYVWLCINMGVGAMAGRTGYYAALLWTACSAFYFMLKTMAEAVPVGTGSTREFMIFGFAGLQVVTMWWLGYTRDLDVPALKQ